MPKFNPLWKTGYEVCRLFCREEFVMFSFNHNTRWSWHKCAGARAEQRRLKQVANREYNARVAALKGKVVTPRSEIKAKHKPRESWARAREVAKGVKIKNRQNRCQTCHQWTVNRFHCPTCLDRLESGFDLGMMMEVGESRRMGVRG